MRKPLFPIVILLFFLSVSAETALACSCVGRPAPDEAYNRASAVFFGLVTKIEPDLPDGDLSGSEQFATVRIEQAFKGVRSGTFIVLDQPSSDCAPKFKQGQRWLFYADYDRKSRTWEVGGCGRSAKEDDAQDDLLYLRALPESATRSRISGTIKEYEETPDRGFAKIRNVPDVRVKITGEGKTYEVYTDKNGVYEIYDLAPGSYSIEAEAPPGLAIRFPMLFGGLLKPNGCSGSDFVLSSDTRIRGTVFGANGEVLPDACIDLVPFRGPVSPYFHIFNCTDANGHYELTEVPPGKYLIMANKRGQVSPSMPFGTVYYPSVFDKGNAAVINVSGGEKLEGYDIHIPAQQRTNSVSGVLLYSDGRPIARGGSVRFTVGDEHVPGTDPNAHAPTDRDGHFSLTVFHGSVGWLSGHLTVFRGQFIDCPQIDKHFQRGHMLAEIESEPIRIQVDDDISGLKIVMPFASCTERNR